MHCMRLRKDNIVCLFLYRNKIMNKLSLQYNALELIMFNYVLIYFMFFSEI